MNEIRLYKSVWKGLKLIGLSSMFVVPCAFFLIKGEGNSTIWWMGLLFFGIGYLVGGYVIFDRRPQIIINDVGIFDRNLGQNVINWEIIKGAYPAEINKQKFICLEVDEQYEPSRQKGKFYRSVARLNKELGFQELNIYVAQVKVDPDKLLAFILMVIQADKQSRDKLIESGLE